MGRTLPPLVVSLGALLAFAIGGCGGGADEGSAPPARCSTESVLVISTTWNSNGSVAATVQGNVGVPLVATPTITGIPPSCAGQQTFRVNVPSGLPAGLSLNPTTGVISGTPTQGISIAGPSCCGGVVAMDLPGYAPVQVLGIITIF